MTFKLPPPLVRLAFVVGVIAAGAAVYEFAQGARPLALLLGFIAAGALALSSRQKEHL